MSTSERHIYNYFNTKMLRAISSTNVVIEGSITPATIIFSTKSGKIIDVINKVLDPQDELISIYNISNYRNLSPLLILPGLVDSHVHLNEPGRTEWEGFASGTQLLISGGVTTIIDMPLNAIPPTTTLENFEIKLKLAEGQVWCDVGFWGGLVPDNLKHLVPLIKAGVRGFKGFLIDSGVDEFPLITPHYIDNAMQTVKGYKTVLMFHAEMQPRTSLGPQITTTANKQHLLLQFNIIDDETYPTTIQEQTPPLEDDIDDISLGMSQSFISRAPLPVSEMLKHTLQHKEDHAHCKLPHNHAGSIDHSVLSDEQLIALAQSPMLSAAEPKIGHAANLANHHHQDAANLLKSPLLEAAEDNSVLEKIDPTLYASFLASRPDVFETTAIGEIIACATKEPSVPLHIVHLATHELIPLIRAALEKNLQISVETCFHYLSLTAELIMNGSTQYKCCPPIRTEENQKLLWQLLKEKIIKTVVSDHSPCIPELKSFNTGDFFEAWGGISSIGLGLSILFTESHKYDINIIDIVQWCCENTAKQVGLSHQKGFIKSGYDADFAIFDPSILFTVQNDQTFFKNKFTLYDGKQMNGRVVETIVRGNSVFALGKGVSELPMGNLILDQRIL